MVPKQSIVEASIQDLSAALASGQLTAVDLAARCLLRIAVYDCRNGYPLNSVPLINENVFDEAAAADDRRAAGQSRGVLDGIPYTVKDSYKVKDMTVASGSEAFEELIANEDAFVVGALRSAGAVLIGKTNMCPMAAGGMIRGLYGRAESPYNAEYLAAAFVSGSSNGSGVATAASFAAFGMGEETVSSGRSPASNNGLVAYTPSRGLISIRGNWPLYPTCDVIVPHTRTMDDLLLLLDVIAATDNITTGDFWRDQPFISLPLPWLKSSGRPFSSVKDIDHLKGKRIAVPRMYLEQSDGGPYISDSIRPLWEQARISLEQSGAKIEVSDDFPVIQAYENPGKSEASSPRLPEDWNATERGSLIAHAWEDFLCANKSSNIPSLSTVSPTKIFPHLPRSNPQVQFTEPANAINWSALQTYVSGRPSTSSRYAGKSPLYDIPNLEEALTSLEAMRKHYFEDWMTSHGYDYVAFPAVGDVGRSDADVNIESAEHAWRNGVKYSHGNRMLRHLGIPSVTVPMGILDPSGMPIGLTILGRSYDDIEILKAGWTFEQARRGRVAPPLTPALPSDAIPGPLETVSKGPRPELNITRCQVALDQGSMARIVIEGTVTIPSSSSSSSSSTPPIPTIQIFIDGKDIPTSAIEIKPATAAPSHQQLDSVVPTSTSSAASDFHFHFQSQALVPLPPLPDARDAVVGKIARDSTMVVILARSGQRARPSGWVKLIHRSTVI